ncbi:hypothetical protein TI03_02390 [Achromatium sp. WMS1]|nr:hypothetical protein TI03_02390 [Achromatium sp. WMS1]
MSLNEIQKRLRNIDYDRTALQQALEYKKQQTKKKVAQEVKDLIKSRGHDVMDILNLITNSKNHQMQQMHTYLRYVDPDNPKNQYTRGVLPKWMKDKMKSSGFDPNNKDDRQIFKERYLEAKMEE